MPKKKILRCRNYLSEPGLHMGEGKGDQVSQAWRDILEGGPPEDMEGTRMLHLVPELVQG